MRYARLNAIGLIEFATEKLTEEQLQEGGFLPYEEEEKPVLQEGVIPYNYTLSFEETNGKIIGSWKAYPNYTAIDKLKDKLYATDYRIIKCFEMSLIGGEMPYNIDTLHAERQEIRDEINRLEACK